MGTRANPYRYIYRSLNETQRAIYNTLAWIGPATDQEIQEILLEFGYEVSPSGARTRRKELVDLWLVEHRGYATVISPTGREIQQSVWGVANTVEV